MHAPANCAGDGDRRDIGHGTLVSEAHGLIWMVALAGWALGASEPADSTQRIWEIDLQTRYQRMEGFGASDAWAAQFVGRWPDPQRERVAELLFSRGFDEAGRPRGIGLAIWRFNIGAGSAEQGAESGIRDPWRRAECFQNERGEWDWSKQAGQQWFLEAARRHGVETFVAFVNSPPVHLTRNGRAWGDGGAHSNLAPEQYEAFADFLAEVCAYFERTGRPFQYLSPINEPQWRWSSRNGQEGCPWTNEEIRRLTPVLGAALARRAVQTHLVLPEAATYEHLLAPMPGEPLSSDQLRELYGDRPDAVVRARRVAPIVAAHGYHTTDDRDRMLRIRRVLGQRLSADHPGLRLWMSEYCILGRNDEGRLHGTGRDLGMDPALFLARVIHADLTWAGATSWQWWLGVSPYDYKDGLVYVDRNPTGGRVYESKLLWVFGHYARFIRPGARRVRIQPAEARDRNHAGAETVLLSAWAHPGEATVTVVGINPADREVTLILRMPGDRPASWRSFVTTAEAGVDLAPGPVLENGRPWTLPARSVVTWVCGPLP